VFQKFDESWKAGRKIIAGDLERGESGRKKLSSSWGNQAEEYQYQGKEWKKEREKGQSKVASCTKIDEREGTHTLYIYSLWRFGGKEKRTHIVVIFLHLHTFSFPIYMRTCLRVLPMLATVCNKLVSVL
jgi:hypothetical protein